MALCGSQNCACAITSDSLSITGSGTAGSPWVIEQATAGPALIPQYFTDTTERDASLPVPDAGQMAWTNLETTLWIWDGTDWVSTGGPTLTVTAGFTAATNWTMVSTTGYRIGNQVALAITAQRTTAVLTGDSTTDIANTLVCTTPTSLRGPIATLQALNSLATGRVALGTYNPSNGNVNINQLGGTVDLAVGGQISLGGTVIVE